MAPQWTHLARFIAKEDGRVHLGQIDPAKVPDVGRAVFKGEQVAAHEVTGGVFDGVVTGRVLHVDRLLSPLAPSDVPLIRCMGINYHDHAKEANIPPPTEPILFIKPRTALNGPYPAAINVPTIAQDGTSDYEAELTFVIGKEGKDIPQEKALEYVLGYTCGNDVSARAHQAKTSQPCFSKGFNGSAPIGPVLVSAAAVGDPEALDIKALHNGNEVQDSNTREMIFGIAKMVSWLSSGTTLERGTVVMTGSGPGTGWRRNPKIVLRHGDDMRVYIQGIGTLINEVYYE